MALSVAAVLSGPGLAIGGESPTRDIVLGEIVIRVRSDAIATSRTRNLRAQPLSPSITSAVLNQYGATDIAPLFCAHRTLASPRSSIIPGTAVSPAKDEALDLAGTYVVHVDAGSDLLTLAADLSRDPNVMWAEPNRVYHATAVDERSAAAVADVNQRLRRASAVTPAFPNDPYLHSSGSWGQGFPDMWGWYAIAAPEAWNASQGADVVVAVVDTGLDVLHPDIRRNVWRNSREIAGNHVDDGDNGFVDDLRGWDFTRCTMLNADGGCAQAKLPGHNVRDRYGHGTHVAGIIAAVGGNGRGIVGIAPRASIMPLKALDDTGRGAASDLAAAIVYAADNGAGVVNMSWTGAPSETIRMAVQYADARGAVIVAAAGNSAVPLQSGISPANLPAVIAVGATDQQDRSAPFSNVGGPLALVAPGGGDTDPATDPDAARSILSLLGRGSSFGVDCRYEAPCEDCAEVKVCTRLPFVLGGRYVRTAGTSMSAAFVSGVAALVRSHRPNFTSHQVRQVLLETADDLGPPGWDRTFGYGRVNAQRAVAVDTIPVAEIVAPINGDKLHDWQLPFTVRGTAQVPDGILRQWQLTLRESGTLPALFTQVGEDEVIDGPLTTLEADRLEPGKRYILELEVTDTDGHAARDSKDFLVPDPKFAVVPLPAPIAPGGRAKLSADGTRLLVTHTGLYDEQPWFFDAPHDTRLRLTEGFSFSGWMSRDGDLVSYVGALPDGTYCNGVSTEGQSSVVFDVESHEYSCLPRGVDVSNAAVDASGKRTVFPSAENLDPSRPRHDDIFEMFMYDEREGRIRQLTAAGHGPFGNEVSINPVIDDSGQLVAFDANVPLDPAHAFVPDGARHVFVYDDRDHTTRELTAGALGAPNGYCVSLSRDGRTLAFLSVGGLFIADTASGALRPVVDPSISPGCPQLSGDGTAVAFEAIGDLDPRVENEDASPEVFLLDLASGAFAQVTDSEIVPGCNPSLYNCGVGVTAINQDATTFVATAVFNPKSAALPFVLSSPRIVPVKPGNHAPILTVPERVELPILRPTRIAVVASDADGDHITFAANRVPWSKFAVIDRFAGYVMDDHGDGSAILTFTPARKEIGQYTIRVAAFDAHGGVAVKDLQVTVTASGS